MGNRKAKKIIVSVLALLLVAVLVFVLFSTLLYSTNASAASVSDLEDELDGIKQRQEALKAEISGISNNISDVTRKKRALDDQLNTTKHEIDVVTELISELDQSIAAKEQQIIITEEREQDEYEKFRGRVRSMYENGDVTYIGVLLSSDNFSDFLSRYEVVSQIAEFDKKVVSELGRLRTEIEKASAELASEREKQNEYAASLEVKKSEFEMQIAQNETILGELAQDQAEHVKALEENYKEEERIQQEILDMLEAIKKNNTVYVGGDFTWPLPGYSKISSPFGMRYHPILKYNKMHTGVDVGAPRGTEIVAANGGTVVTSASSTAYGNYVVIDHGGGVATLYAHMTYAAVSKDETVKKGEVIGYVGSTGYSTGNHLHFEIIVDGEHKNPMNYFTKA